MLKIIIEMIQLKKEIHISTASVDHFSRVVDVSDPQTAVPGQPKLSALVPCVGNTGRAPDWEQEKTLGIWKEHLDTDNILGILSYQHPQPGRVS